MQAPGVSGAVPDRAIRLNIIIMPISPLTATTSSPIASPIIVTLHLCLLQIYQGCIREPATASVEAIIPGPRGSIAKSYPVGLAVDIRIGWHLFSRPQLVAFLVLSPCGDVSGLRTRICI